MKDFVTLCQFLGIPKSIVQGCCDEVRAKFVLRRTKSDVCKFNKRLEMPPCDFENVELEMYEEEQKVYDQVFDESVNSINELFKAGVQVSMRNMHILECFLKQSKINNVSLDKLYFFIIY